MSNLRISEIYAFVARDAQGNEGVCAFRAGELMMPMMGADIDRAASLKEMARAIAIAEKTEVRLVRFTKREEVEVIAP